MDRGPEWKQRSGVLRSPESLWGWIAVPSYRGSIVGLYHWIGHWGADADMQQPYMLV